MRRALPLRAWTAALACAWAAVLLVPGDARGEPAPRLSLDPAAKPELLYAYKQDACDSHDLPDVPARAFRDAHGRITLLATNYVHRALIGHSFATLSKRCEILYKPSQIGEPALYDDKAWIQAVYTEDGRTIHALLSADFHEYRHSARCPSGNDTNKCWYNAITAAVSTDGGATFRPAHPPPAHYVAGPSVRYDLHAGRSIGFFTTSNIVAHRGHRSTLAYTGGGFGGQQRGACLLRTAALDDPSSWRAWDGKGFDHRFVDPYRADAAPPAGSGCKPVSPRVFGGPVRGLLRHEASGTFVAVMLAAAPARGVYYSVSKDLIDWADPVPLMLAPTRAEVKSGRNKDAAVAIDYPSVIDHASLGRNFEFLAGEPYLYYVDLPAANGKLTGERRLMRRRLVLN
jgi:hypothetical protein